VTRFTKIGSSSVATGPSAGLVFGAWAGVGGVGPALAVTRAGADSTASSSVSNSSESSRISSSLLSRTRGGRVAFCSALASAFFLCGPMTMIMFRPSCFGVLST
jgi:hypothetical protein